MSQDGRRGFVLGIFYVVGVVFFLKKLPKPFNFESPTVSTCTSLLGMFDQLTFNFCLSALKLVVHCCLTSRSADHVFEPG